jgi:hypothetical protein
LTKADDSDDWPCCGEEAYAYKNFCSNCGLVLGAVAGALHALKAPLSETDQQNQRTNCHDQSSDFKVV